MKTNIYTDEEGHQKDRKYSFSSRAWALKPVCTKNDNYVSVHTNKQYHWLFEVLSFVIYYFKYLSFIE